MRTTRSSTGSLRFSKFCHILPRSNNQYILFHSLNMEIVYLVDGFSKMIDYFKNGKSVQSIIEQSELSEEDKSTLIKFVHLLVKFEMLVPVQYDETNDLEKYRKENLPGPVINLMYLILTDECNFACTYCYIENAMPSDYKFSYMTPRMATKRIDDFAKWSGMKKSKNKSILFYGGEPLMNKDVFEKAVLHIQKLKEKNILPQYTDISLITNGSLITKEIAEFIKENGVKVGLSVDGSSECNDICRKFLSGKGTSDAIWRGYMHLKDAGVEDIGISLTVGYHNIGELLENTKYVVEKFSVKSLGYNILMDGENNILATFEYAQQASEEIIKCFEYLREKGIYEDRVMRKVEFFANKMVYPSDCAACGRQFVALPDGKIGPCQAFMGSKKHFVNKNRSFSPYDNETFIEWSSRSPLSMPQCYDCVALGLCGGGCPCRAEIRSGDIWAIDEIFCQHSKKTVEWLINDFAKQDRI
jgi:uncharacterized protein